MYANESVKRRLGLCLAAGLAAMMWADGAAAQEAPANAAALVTPAVVDNLRSVLSSDLVRRSILAQNARYGALSQSEIDALDKQWRAEREAGDKPLIAMTLSNPLSSYLTREQANALGLYAAIFVMDKNGLNAGQSAITGDFWQGDEAKFQKTYSVSPDAVFVDEPEWLEDFSVWIVQVNLAIADPATGRAIGAATFDVNLNELERRAAAARTN
ncbi:MAG: hypothetical protein AAFW46_11265 [Pseudomonadota bacterium]